MQKLNDNIFQTGRDKVISTWAEKTGLDEKRITKLYESFSANTDGSLVKINESFDLFIAKKIPDFAKFEADIAALATRIGDVELNDEERFEVTATLVEMLNEVAGSEIDMVSLIQIVCFLLSGNDNFNITGLNESYDENPDIYFLPISGNIPLYESLVEILVKNNTITGYPNQIKNMHNSIVNYLRKEIEETTNKNNVHSIDTENHINIINEIFVAQTINPMYLSSDVMRTLVPDIQSFVFDLAFIIDKYFVDNKYSIEFVNEKQYLGYVGAVDLLFTTLSTSLKDSKIVSVEKGWQHPSGTLFSNYHLNIENIRIPNEKISTNQAANMIHIIKAATNEFNLKIRKVINTYVTKTLELLISSEKVIIKQKNL